jgi:AraC-like DNA-binding protein
MNKIETRYDKEVGPARGVLRDAALAGDFHHSRHAAPAALAAWVQHFWSVRWEVHGQQQQVQTLPHPSVHLLIERERSRIVGIAPGRFTRTLEGRGMVFGVKFLPGGFRPFLGRPVSTITGLSLPINAVFADADDIEAQVLALKSPEEMVKVMSHFLLARVPASDENVGRVARIVAGIVDDRGITQVEQLALRENMNKRALQRLFSDYVGASPKWVINRYRMHEAVEQLALGRPPDWTALALDLGYFDQAHFIRDFKALVGQSPAEYTRRASASEIPAPH